VLVAIEDHPGGIIPFRGQEAACDAIGIVAGRILTGEVESRLPAFTKWPADREGSQTTL